MNDTIAGIGVTISSIIMGIALAQVVIEVAHITPINKDPESLSLSGGWHPVKDEPRLAYSCMYSRDRGITAKVNVTGSNPFFIDYEEEGRLIVDNYYVSIPCTQHVCPSNESNLSECNLVSATCPYKPNGSFRYMGPDMGRKTFYFEWDNTGEELKYWSYPLHVEGGYEFKDFNTHLFWKYEDQMENCKRIG